MATDRLEQVAFIAGIIFLAAILAGTQPFSFGSASNALDIGEGNVQSISLDSYRINGDATPEGDNLITDPIALPSSASLQQSSNINNFPEDVYNTWERNGLILDFYLDDPSNDVVGVKNPEDFEASCEVRGWTGSTDTKATGPIMASITLEGVADEFASHQCRVLTGTVTCLSGDCSWGSSASISELDRLDRDVLGNIDSSFHVVYDLDTGSAAAPDPTDPVEDPVVEPAPTIVERIEMFLNQVLDGIIGVFR